MTGHKVRRFRGFAARRPGGGATIPLPFDPAEAWGRRHRYHVTGTVDEVGFRTTLVRDKIWQIVLGPKSPSAASLEDGQSVIVAMWPEGPQQDQLAADVGDALASHPQARAAFEALATFYRKGWLRWIDATKRRPEVRAARIAEMVKLLEAGHKERLIN